MPSTLRFVSVPADTAVTFARPVSFSRFLLLLLLALPTHHFCLFCDHILLYRLVPVPQPGSLSDWTEFLQWLGDQLFQQSGSFALFLFLSLFFFPHSLQEWSQIIHFILFRMMAQSGGIPSSVPQIQSVVQTFGNVDLMTSTSPVSGILSTKFDFLFPFLFSLLFNSFLFVNRFLTFLIVTQLHHCLHWRGENLQLRDLCVHCERE